jgi:hypothetical protein
MLAILKGADLNLLIFGGQLYLVFHFSKGSLAKRWLTLNNDPLTTLESI